LFLLARVLLTSSLAVDRVRSQLEDILGVPVKLDAVDVGLFSVTTLTGLHLQQRDASGTDRPWLSVDRVQAGVSVIGLLLGRAMPPDISLDGVVLELQFNSTGELQTRLPPLKGGGTMPALHIEQGKLILDQKGRPTLELQGLHGLIHAVDQDLRIEGDMEDPEWGTWRIAGGHASSTGEFSLNLHNNGIHVTPAQLARLPIVSPTIWNEVRAEGDTPVDFSVRYGSADSSVHYRVDLRPRQTTVRIQAIDLNADEASGRVVVEDGKVQLRDVSGRTASGEITTSADLDFTTAVYRFHFNPVSVRNVELKSLPPSWRLPPTLVRLGGTLQGLARLQVTIDGARIRTSGDGKGLVRTTLAGKEADIGLALHAAGKEFRFDTDSTDEPQSLRDAILLSLIAVQAPADASKPSLPWQTVNQAPRGLALLGQSITRGANAVMDGVKQARESLDPTKPPTYLTASLKLDDVDIARLLRELNVKLPVAITGRLSFNVQLGLPVNATTDYKAYRMSGTAQLLRADVAGLQISEVRGRVRLDNGVLTVDELRGTVPAVRKDDPAGGFSGKARIDLFPLGDLTASMTLDHLPLDVLLNRLPGTANLAHGLFDGDFTLRAQASRLSEPAAYVASGTIRAEKLFAYGLTLTKATGQLSLDQGTARVRKLRGTLEGAVVALEGQADLTARDVPYQGKATLEKADLTALARLAPSFRPAFTVEGMLGVTADLRGTLTPLTLQVNGAAKATMLTLARFRLDEVSLAWARNGDALALTDVDARLYGGRIAGKATVPLTAKETGKFELTASEVEAKDLANALAPLPLRLEGRVSGTLTADVAAADKDGTRKTTLDMELTAGRLRIQKIPTQHVKATLRQVEGHLEYRLIGDVLGGSFELEGKTSRIDLRKNADNLEGGGRLSLVGLRLSQLGSAFDLRDRLDPLQGRLDLELNYKNEGADDWPVGTGRVTVRNVRWGGTEVTDSVRGLLRLTDRDFQIRDVNGTIANGGLRAVAVIRLRQPGGWFSLTLEHMDAERVLAPFPSLTNVVQGPLDAQLRGSLGNAWRGSGQVTLHRGHTLGVGLSEWRLPVEFGHNLGSGEGFLDVRDSTAQIGQGRAQGHASLRWGEGVRLEGLVTFFNADLKTLIRSTGQTSTLAAGRLSGRLDFGAANLRSADDLVALLDAQLTQTQAFQLPVLSVLTPYFAPGRGNATFDRGSIRARLSGGVVRVQHLRLTGSLLNMLIEGTVNLQGRLDLDATAGTGNLGVNAVGLRLLAQRIPAVGPLPVGLIAQVTAFFANRLVHLHIGGTLRNPTIRVDPLALLTEEAVRFFVLNPVGLYPSIP
jgi:hypothetical protein